MRLMFPTAGRFLLQQNFPRIPGAGIFSDAVIMQREEQTEEEIILALTVSDEALEQAANSNFSLGNCTDARVCPMPA